MDAISIPLNGRQHSLVVPPETPVATARPGTFMTTAALLAKNSTPMDSDVYEVFARHVCRCITCQRIRRAVQQAAVKHPSAETAPPTPTAAGGAR
jgi:xanthine dehydrogenase iron-sulfur cluster and FAD-binding subunit A